MLLADGNGGVVAPVVVSPTPTPTPTPTATPVISVDPVKESGSSATTVPGGFIGSPVFWGIVIVLALVVVGVVAKKLFKR